MSSLRYTDVRAIELAAQRARSREIARLLRLAGSAIAGIGRRFIPGETPKRMRHA